ncbi:MAG TPA: tetratricopeptide repeat protein [Syntrophorhabdaceae bacterium]|nr:tetratricopeptide repeat protein [Syntrophorhabdaceae bacterium]HEX3007426.1 tetratricopeptide repeat protein [Bacteroidales bacterium]
MKILISLLLVIGLLGCSTTTRMYSGPALPENQTALVRGGDVSINLVSCDGVKVTSSAIMVLPGEHTIEMSYSGSGGYSINNTFTKFKAEAGHTYVVDKDNFTRPGRYTTFITDITANKKVSSPADKPKWALEESLFICERNLKGSPRDANLWAEKGNLLVKLNRCEEALPAIDTAISLDANVASRWSLKSRALYELKQYDEALTAIDRALQLRPGYESDIQGRQTILKAMGK